MKITITNTNVTYSAVGSVITSKGDKLGEINTGFCPDKATAKAMAQATAKELGGKPVITFVSNKDVTEMEMETSLTVEQLENLIGTKFQPLTKKRRTFDEVKADIEREKNAYNIGRSENGNYMYLVDPVTGKTNRTLTGTEVKALEELGGI